MLRKKVETNEQRAKRLGLRPAPVLRGYFFKWKDCVGNLQDNLMLARQGQPPRFKQMFLETINACNLKCPMCYTAARDADGRERLGLAELKRAIKRGKEAGVEVVAIAGRGEPLMDPNFWELGEAVRNEGMDLLVFTNGLLVTPDIAKRLKETCTTVITKVFAMDAEAHNLLVGMKGEYVKTRKALVNLLETGLREPNLGIDLVITKRNERDLDNILRMCRMLGIIPYFERLAPIGRAKKLNGNIVLPDETVNGIFGRLRTIDEQEFGVTWTITPDMPALANAETDKRMIAFHLDVFGDVQPGLATGKTLGNIRDVDGGIGQILDDRKTWAAYFKEVADEIGLERVAGLLPEAKKEPWTILENAAEKVRELYEEHAKECRAALEEGRVPGAVKRVVDGLAEELEDTEYWPAYEAIRRLVLEEKLYLRAAGELLLMELIYGRRHLGFCDAGDLRDIEWEAWGIDRHLAKDPVWKRFQDVGGFGPINHDRIEPCQPFKLLLLKQFVADGLEFAAMNQVKWMVPEDCGHEDCRRKMKPQADEFGRILGQHNGRAMPILLNLAYEHAGGMKDIPKNEVYSWNAREAALEQLGRINEGLREAGEPLRWLTDNTACRFVGANDLGALAGYLYHNIPGEARQTALETLRLLATNITIRGKLMRKRGIPKVL